MRSPLVASAVWWIVMLATAHAGDGGIADPRQIAVGRRVYQAQCASCHGSRGEGAPNWPRPDGQGEMPAPPHDREGHSWKHADGMLYRIVRDGWRDPFNKTERLTMPAFGKTLPPEELRAVIDYLKTLWTPDQRRFQEEESRRAPFPAATR